MQTPKKPKGLPEYKYDKEMKEYVPPKGKLIEVNLNLFIVILIVWWLMLFGASFVDKELITSVAEMFKGEEREYSGKGVKIRNKKSKQRQKKE